MNSIEPFVSAEDIYAGTRWQSEIASQLDSTNFGIVCVTRENQAAPWLNFEAGALAKVLDQSRLIPLAVDLKPSDVHLPLGQFQAQSANEEGMRAVVVSLNDALGEDRLLEAVLLDSFEMWWPRLKDQLETIEHQTSAAAPPPRPERELLEETLNTVRGLARAIDQAPLRSTGMKDRLVALLERDRLDRALEALPDRERQVLMLRFGLEDDEPKTLEEIGKRLKLTRERVRQIEGQALARLSNLNQDASSWRDLLCDCRALRPLEWENELAV
jgi:RNA polymerase sigma factor (sigma-70 family)